MAATVECARIDPAEIEDAYFAWANQAGENNRNIARMASLLAD
jgi:acetyl-CoA acetyltransferase